MSADPTYEAGMAVRREVLGASHVDRAEAAKTPFTSDFQAFITRTAWGSVWVREGLERRTRSVATLTALMALGHWDEFVLHLHAAERNGVSRDEIGELILHNAIYCGIPAANHAFALAQREFEKEGDDA